jgi:type IV pilus assembly protein PilC
MAKYLFKAKNTSGDLVSGSVLAENEIQAENILLKNSLILVDLEPEKLPNFTLPFLDRFTLHDKLMLTRQLSTMVAAGVSLPKAMGIIAVQTQGERAKAIYYKIIAELESGQSFSTALAKFPDVFDPVMIAVIRSGEQTGNLDKVLDQLAKQFERDNYLVSKIRNALLYPSVILVAMFGIGVTMMVYIVPKFKEIFVSSQVDLPTATRILISISDSITSYWYMYLILLIGLIIGSRAFIISDYGQYAFDSLKLRFPVVRKISEGVYVTRLAQTLAMMSRSGVPILESIRLASTTINNELYREGLEYAASQVERGLPLSVPLSKNTNFPVLLSQMVAVGEQTGHLEGVMEKLGQYYEEETDERIKGMSSLIEPVLMILIGVAVAFIVISVITPIYKIAQIQ